MVLDVHAPAEPGAWPVVVLVHGYGGTRADLTPLAAALATAGAVVFNADAVMFEPFSDAIGQIACAVRFARAKAAGHGGDATTIVLVGYSSGAHTGSVVALAGDVFDGGCRVEEGSPVPDVFVGYEGPYDVAQRSYGGLDVTHLETGDPELWAAIDPYTHVGGQTDPAVVLIHGVDEDVEWYDVAPEVSTTFHETLLDEGYDAEMVLLDGADHIDLWRNGATEAVTAVVDAVLASASANGS